MSSVHATAVGRKWYYYICISSAKSRLYHVHATPPASEVMPLHQYNCALKRACTADHETQGRKEMHRWHTYIDRFVLNNLIIFFTKTSNFPLWRWLLWISHNILSEYVTQRGQREHAIHLFSILNYILFLLVSILHPRTVFISSISRPIVQVVLDFIRTACWRAFLGDFRMRNA